MSTDPQSAAQPGPPAEGGTDDTTGTVGPAAPDGTAPGPTAPDRTASPVAPARGRAGSSLLARVLTIAYALVITPIATGLLSYGGSGWLQYVMVNWSAISLGDFFSSPAAVPVVLGLVIGLLLLLSVVATGFASSAGLLAVGVMSLVSITLAVVPSLLFPLYGALPSQEFFAVADGFVVGLPLVLHVLIGGLGLALVLARSRPEPHLALSMIGIPVVPIVLLAGLGLAVAGLARGTGTAVMTLQPAIDPLAIVLVAAGSLLIVLAAAATGWSPYALVIPALLLVAVSLMLLAPGGYGVLGPLWSTRTGATASRFLYVGGGLSAALVMLFHVVVLSVVRTRARRRLPTAL
jgi:hypothetical protein